MSYDFLERIVWLGHAGFVIRGGDKTVVIDPYNTTFSGPADVILVTHSHYDHCSVEDIDRIDRGRAVIVTESRSAAKLTGRNTIVLTPGQAIDIDDIHIEAVLAYNVDKTFHPKENGGLGFIVTADGQRIYHTGDTDLIPEMDKIRADIVLVPVSGTYVMTAGEAVEAVKRIKPKLAIPMHYNAIVGTIEDARRFQRGLTGICDVALLEAESD